MIKRLTPTIATLLLASGVMASSVAFAGSAEPARSSMAVAEPTSTADGGGHRRDFEQFLERYEAANTAFVNGDSSLWRSMATEKDPASIFGGFGGLGESGVAEVTQRYLLAAGAFQPSGAEVDFEYLVKDVQRKYAYTVAIETRRRALHGAHRTAPPGPARHDDLPLRAGRLADRPSPRRHDGRLSNCP